MASTYTIDEQAESFVNDLVASGRYGLTVDTAIHPGERLAEGSKALGMSAAEAAR